MQPEAAGRYRYANRERAIEGKTIHQSKADAFAFGRVKQI
jgi:hypothetical protein